jgi:DNA-binding transcriptional LysR family regulator
MSSSSSWDDFRLVKAISDSRSLVGASQTLDLNHSTVFRRLGALEEKLSTRLFERSRNGYTPTAAGEEMIRLAGRMDQDIVDFERRIAGRDVKPAGDLRVTTNDAILVHLMTRVFAAFREAYPDIRLDVVMANQSLNLSKRDADVAIRATLEPADTLVGRRIARFGWARYAAKSWGDRNRALQDETAPWVGFTDALSQIAAAKWLAANVESRRIVYRVDTVLGMAEAIAAGIGMVIVPCFIGDRMPSLIRLGMQKAESAGEFLWLLTHTDMRNSARVRAFMDFASAELSKQKKLIEGE